MIVDELTKEMSMDRRMQKAGDCSMGETVPVQRRKRTFAGVGGQWTVRWKAD